MMWIQIIVVLLSIHSLHGQLTFLKYNDIQGQIGVIPYTVDQRKQVAQSVYNMLTIDVNRQSKAENYESQYQDIDPLPRVAKLIKQAALMKDIDFHYALVDIFMSLRDLRTSYEMPGPHRCVDIYKPVSFGISGHGEHEKIIVVGYYDGRVTTLFPSTKLISIGDELISIDGISVQEIIKKSNFARGGANGAGSLRAVLESFSKISGKIHKLPQRYTDAYMFKTITGKSYKRNLPWISVIDSECWVQSKGIIHGGALPTLELNNHTDHFMSEEAKRLLVPQIVNFDLGFQSAGSIVKWKIHRSGSKKLGIITLQSFKAIERDPLIAVNIIRNLLLLELKETDSILIDVRLDLNGLVELADLIPQLFGVDIKTGSFRASASYINEEYFAADSNLDWFASFKNVKIGVNFTNHVQITTNEQANRIGQAYIKPVGVFTSGKCYAACEIFVANMKDNNIAAIFGEDYTSGGGGSIGIDYNTHLSIIQPTYFQPVPFIREIHLGAQNFHVAWKQFVRIDGNLIDDKGVKSDYIVRPELSDFQFSSRSATQYEIIANVLFRQGVDKGLDKLQFEIYPKPLEIVCKQGFDFVVHYRTAGIKNVVIYGENDELIQNTTNTQISQSINFHLVVNTENKALGIERYKFLAFDQNNKLVYSTWKIVKYLPKPRNYLSISRSINIPLELVNSIFVGLYDYSRTGWGWIKLDAVLAISSHGRDIESQISYFLNFYTDENFVLITGTYYLKEARDYLKIGCTSADGKVTYLFDTNTDTRDARDLTTFSNAYQIPLGFVELFFKFKSDDTSHSGATINTIDVF